MRKFIVQPNAIRSSQNNNENNAFINPLSEINDFTIYPNPSKGEFSINILNSTNEYILVKVVDITGREVYIGTISDNNLDCKLPNLVAGIYNVQLITNNSIINKKLIIEQ